MRNRFLQFAVLVSAIVIVAGPGVIVALGPSPVGDPYAGVLLVTGDFGSGSCFVIDRRDDYWYAITAAHVLEYEDAVTVDEEFYEVEIVDVDDMNDVALIRFRSPEVYVIYEFADAVAGEPCVAVGWSSGSRLVYKGYVVSTDLDGDIAANGGVLPGCSGGPLLNAENKVLGVTKAVTIRYIGVFDSTAVYVPAFVAEMLIGEE